MTDSQVDLQAIRAKLRSLQPERHAGSGSSPSWNLAARPRHGNSATVESADAAEVLPDWEAPTHPVSPAIATEMSSAHPVAETVEALQRRSLQLQRSEEVERDLNIPPLPDPTTAAHQRWMQSWRQLQDQVRRVNQLAVAQEAALLDLKTMAETAAHWRLAARGEMTVTEAGFDVLALLAQDGALTVPQVKPHEQGRWIISNRAVDLFQAQRDAQEMAQVLRQGQHRRSQPSEPLFHFAATIPPIKTLQSWLPWRQALGLEASGPKRRHPRNRKPSPAVDPTASLPEISLPDIAIWVIGAALFRVGFDLLLAAWPILWPPVLLLGIASVAIAIYRTTVSSASGLILGYRLLLIMLGLLLGGRLL